MGKWRGGFWRSLGVGLLGVLLLAFPSFASAACTTQALPEVTIRPESASTGWCVTGSVVSGAEPHITFTVPVAGLWQASLEALPGQDGLALMAIQGDNGPRQIWQAATRRAEGTATSPLLFLAAGTYSVAVETPGAALVYRLALNPGPGLPPDLTSPVTGAFSAVVRGTDEKSVTSWAVDQNSTDQLWTIAAQGAVGLSMSLAVLDASGTTILSTSSPDEAGVFRLPDLQLATGIYQLVVSGLPGEVPVFLGAEQQARPAGFAAEPDGHPEQAHRIEPSQPITGRLITEGSYGEHDYFVLTVPGGPEAPGYDINLSAPTPASLSLVLLGADGTTLLQRDGQRTVSIRICRCQSVDGHAGRQHTPDRNRNTGDNTAEHRHLGRWQPVGDRRIWNAAIF